MIFILGLILVTTLVMASPPSPPSQAACSVPICDGRVDTGIKDSNGCTIYDCPTTPITCSMPACENYEVMGKDPNTGCSIYACQTTPGPKSCTAPICEGRQDSGNKDANGCPIYTCQTRSNDYVSETITCKFIDSKEEQGCYAVSGSSTTVEANTQKITSCKGIESCSFKFNSQKGEKVTWKSTCGGYGYTTQDGNDEEIKFCDTQETRPGVTPIEIKGDGFMIAYWQCHNGEEQKESEEECKSYAEWQSKASESCYNKCSNTNGVDKCGVNSFSLIRECHLEKEDESSGGSGGGSSGSDSSDKCPDYKEACDFGKESACKIWKEECGIDEKVTICKDSCSLDSKCYPFGYRKSGNYCSDSGSFTKQFESESQCDNNFECGSNLCVSNQCVSQGLIEQIMAWFKSIFG